MVGSESQGPEVIVRQENWPRLALIDEIHMNVVPCSAPVLWSTAATGLRGRSDESCPVDQS
jgi:hypothetical protein